ncbi:MAG: ribose transport system substrate-binding protein [bacterium]
MNRFLARRTFAAAVAACAVLAVAACGGSSTEESGGSAPEAKKDLTIGVSTPELSSSFWISMLYGLQQEAEAQGVKLVTVNAGGNTNVNQQISQLQDLIQRQVDAMVVGATDGDAVKSAVEQAVTQGIPVVGLSSIPNSTRLSSSVGADHYGMGKLQAQCLGEELGGKGDVAMMTGYAGQSWATARSKGFRETMEKEFPDIRIVAETRAISDRNSALTAMDDWLQRFRGLNGVFTSFDDPGVGVVDAIRSAGRSGRIAVSSSNIGDAAEKLLKSGDFKCLSVQKIVEQGRVAVQQAIAAANKGKVTKEVVTPVVQITKDNLATTDFGPLRAPVSFKP